MNAIRFSSQVLKLQNFILPTFRLVCASVAVVRTPTLGLTLRAKPNARAVVLAGSVDLRNVDSVTPVLITVVFLIIRVAVIADLKGNYGGE